MAIASCLIDTNILLRLARRSDPHHNLIYAAVAKVASDGATLHYTHQNIAELWNVMTRPTARKSRRVAHLSCPVLKVGNASLVDFIWLLLL